MTDPAMRRGRRLVTLGGWIVGLLLAARAPGEVPWYEHYARGLELESQAAWGQALQELQAAAKVVPIPQKHVQTVPGKTIAE